jgi:hypothetical protein
LLSVNNARLPNITGRNHDGACVEGGGKGGGGDENVGTIANVPAVLVIVAPRLPEAPDAVKSRTVLAVLETIEVFTVKLAVYFATPFM